MQMKCLTIGLGLLSAPCLALSFFTLHVNSQGKVFQKGGQGGNSTTQDVSCVFNKAAERYGTNILVRLCVDGDTRIEDVWRILEAGTASGLHSYIVTEHNVKILTCDLFYELSPNYSPEKRKGDLERVSNSQMNNDRIHNAGGDFSEHGAEDRKSPVESNRSDQGAASPKERSFDMAIHILGSPQDDSVFDKIGALCDVDALRTIAYASRTAAWAMEAGADVQFDNRLEEISLSAIHRLFVIDSEQAKVAIEGYKRAFVVDGAMSLYFKKWEEEAKKRRGAAQAPSSLKR